jgi:hypothetical protein
MTRPPGLARDRLECDRDGGDCVADLAVVRAQPGLFGAVASNPTVSRLIAALAADIDSALPVIRSARAQARAMLWQRGGTPAKPGKAGSRVVVDLDATLVTAHSDKEQCATPRTSDHRDSGPGQQTASFVRPVGRRHACASTSARRAHRSG